MNNNKISRRNTYLTYNNYIKIDDLRQYNNGAHLKYSNLPLDVLYPNMVVQYVDENTGHAVCEVSEEISNNYYENDAIKSDDISIQLETLNNNSKRFNLVKTTSTSHSFITSGWFNVDKKDDEHATSVVVMNTNALDANPKAWTLDIPHLLDIPFYNLHSSTSQLDDVLSGLEPSSVLASYVTNHPNCINELKQEIITLAKVVMLSCNSMCLHEYQASDLYNISFDNALAVLLKLAGDAYSSNAQESDGKMVRFPVANETTTITLNGYECSTEYLISLQEILEYITPFIKSVGIAINGKGLLIEFDSYNSAEILYTNVNSAGFGTNVSGSNVLTLEKLTFNRDDHEICQVHVYPNFYIVTNAELTNNNFRSVQSSIRLIGSELNMGLYLYRVQCEDVISFIDYLDYKQGIFVDASDEIFISAMHHPSFDSVTKPIKLIVDGDVSDSDSDREAYSSSAITSSSGTVPYKAGNVKLNEFSSEFLYFGEIVLQTANEMISKQNNTTFSVISYDSFTIQSCDVAIDNITKSNKDAIRQVQVTSRNGSYSLFAASLDLTIGEIFNTNSTSTALYFKNTGVTNPVSKILSGQYSFKTINVTSNLESAINATLSYTSDAVSNEVQINVTDRYVGLFGYGNDLGGTFADWYDQTFHNYEYYDNQHQQWVQPSDLGIESFGNVYARYTLTYRGTTFTCFISHNDPTYVRFMSGDIPLSYFDGDHKFYELFPSMQTVAYDSSVKAFFGQNANMNDVTVSSCKVFYVKRDAYLKWNETYSIDYQKYGFPYDFIYEWWDDGENYGEVDCVCVFPFNSMAFDYNQVVSEIGADSAYAIPDDIYWKNAPDWYLWYRDDWSDYQLTRLAYTYTKSTTETHYAATSAINNITINGVDIAELYLLYDSMHESIMCGFAYRSNKPYLNVNLTHINNYTVHMDDIRYLSDIGVGLKLGSFSSVPMTISLSSGVTYDYDYTKLSSFVSAVFLDRTNIISPITESMAPAMDVISPTLLADSQTFLQQTLKDALAIQVGNIQSFLTDTDSTVDLSELAVNSSYYYISFIPEGSTPARYTIHHIRVSAIDSSSNEIVGIVDGISNTVIHSGDALGDLYVPVERMVFDESHIVTSPCWVNDTSSVAGGHIEYHSITSFYELRSKVLINGVEYPYYQALIIEAVETINMSDKEQQDSANFASRLDLISKVDEVMISSFNDLSDVYANYCESVFTTQFTSAIDNLVDAGVHDSLSDMNTYLDGIKDGMVSNLEGAFGNVTSSVHRCFSGSLNLMSKCKSKISSALSSAKNTVSTTMARLGTLKANVSYKVQAFSESIQNATTNAVTAFQNWLGLGASQQSTGWSDESNITNKSNLNLAFDVSMPDMSGVANVVCALGSLIDKGINWLCDKVDAFITETFVDGISFKINSSGYETIDIPQFRRRFTQDEFVNWLPFISDYFLEYTNATGMDSATMVFQINTVLFFIQRFSDDETIHVYGNCLFDVGDNNKNEIGNDFSFLKQMLVAMNRARTDYNRFVQVYNYVLNSFSSYFSYGALNSLPSLSEVNLLSENQIYERVFSGAYVETAKQVTKRVSFFSWLTAAVGAVLCCTGFGAAVGGVLIGVGAAGVIGSQIANDVSRDYSLNTVLAKASEDDTFANGQITSKELVDVWMDMPVDIYLNYLSISDFAFHSGYMHAGAGRLLANNSYIPMSIFAGQPSFKYHIITDAERATKTRLNLVVMAAAATAAVVGTVFLGRKISAKRRMYENNSKQWLEKSESENMYETIQTTNSDGTVTLSKRLKPGFTDKDVKKADQKYLKKMNKYQKKSDKAAKLLDGDSDVDYSKDLEDIQEANETIHDIALSNLNKIG